MKFVICMALGLMMGACTTASNLQNDRQDICFADPTNCKGGIIPGDENSSD